MTSETMLYEVQRLDGTPEAVIRAIKIILDEWKLSPTWSLPQTIEVGFWEEVNNTITTWIVQEDCVEKMKTLHTLLVEVFTSTPVITVRSPSNARFWERLRFLQDMILDVYIRSDRYSKQYIHIMTIGPGQELKRKILTSVLAAGGAISHYDLSTEVKGLVRGDYQMYMFAIIALRHNGFLTGVLHQTCELIPKGKYWAEQIKKALSR